MLTWDDFIIFAAGAVLCWSVAALLAYRKGRGKAVIALSLLGILIFGGCFWNVRRYVQWEKPVCFIPGLWLLSG